MLWCILKIFLFIYWTGMIVSFGIYVGQKRQIEESWGMMIFVSFIWPIALLALNDKANLWMEERYDKITEWIEDKIDYLRYRESEKAFNKNEDENRLKRMGYKK